MQKVASGMAWQVSKSAYAKNKSNSPYKHIKSKIAGNIKSITKAQIRARKESSGTQDLIQVSQVDDEGLSKMRRTR
jgi:type IV secretory pathway VirD2 relaxase